MRRTYGEIGVLTPALKVGELEIDILHRCVRVGGHELHLTSLEQNLLYLLAANAGRLLTRDEILDYLWGTDYAAESNVIDRHIRNLRAKLQNDWKRPRYIVTVPGQGYRFVPTSSDFSDRLRDRATAPPILTVINRRPVSVPTGQRRRVFSKFVTNSDAQLQEGSRSVRRRRSLRTVRIRDLPARLAPRSLTVMKFLHAAIWRATVPRRRE